MLAYRPADLHPLFVSAFNRHDVDGLATLYEPSATLVVGGKCVMGAELLRAALTAWLAGRGRMTLVTRSVVESPDGLAVLHGQWTIELPGDNGATRATQGMSTEVVRQQPDRTWRFVIDIPSTPS